MLCFRPQTRERSPATTASEVTGLGGVSGHCLRACLQRRASIAACTLQVPCPARVWALKPGSVWARGACRFRRCSCHLPFTQHVSFSCRARDRWSQAPLWDSCASSSLSLILALFPKMHTGNPPGLYPLSRSALGAHHPREPAWAPHAGWGHRPAPWSPNSSGSMGPTGGSSWGRDPESMCRGAQT